MSELRQETPAAIDRWGPLALRVALVGCQAVAICLTRELWRGRTGGDAVPNLPMVDLAWLESQQFDFFWPLLASLVPILIWPRIGVAIHCGLLATAIFCDQMRIQPEFLSVALLLVGTLARPGPLLVARCHLISLWFFAGLHKLLSPGYLHDTGPRMWHGTVGGLNDRQAFLLSVLAAVLELLLGVLAAIPRTRRHVPALATVLHGGILASLIAQRWNMAVWPWNIAAIAAAFILFRNWNEPLWSLPVEPTVAGLPATSQRSARAWQAAAAVVLVYPALYYVGLADAYVSWCVYSSNAPTAQTFVVADLPDIPLDKGDAIDRKKLSKALELATGEDLQFRHYAALNVPFPPAPRLFVQYFRKTAAAGDVLVIDEPRPFLRWRNGNWQIYVWRKNGMTEKIEIRPD